MTNHTLLTNILIAFIVISILSSTILALNSGLKKQERAECIKWGKQSLEYPLYTSTQWQLEQCKAVGIPLIK